MASDDAARLKNMRIKTGVLKRLAKEKEYYMKESEKERQTLEKMKADGKDEHDIKKQNEVLSESLMMVPDCELKLKNAYAELLQLTEKDKDLNEAEVYQAAVAMIEETKDKI